MQFSHNEMRSCERNNYSSHTVPLGSNTKKYVTNITVTDGCRPRKLGDEFKGS